MSSNNNNSNSKKGRKGRRGPNRDGRQGQGQPPQQQYSQPQYGQQGLPGGHFTQPSGAPAGPMNPNASAFLPLPASLPRNPFLPPHAPDIVPASLITQVRANSPNDFGSTPYVPGQGLRYRPAKQIQQARAPNAPPAAPSSRPTAHQGASQGSPLPHDWENQDQNRNLGQGQGQNRHQEQPPPRPQPDQQTPQGSRPPTPITDPRYVHAWAPASTTSGGSQRGGSVATSRPASSHNPPQPPANLVDLFKPAPPQPPTHLASLFKQPPSTTSTPTNTTTSIRRFLEEPGRVVYEQQYPALRELIMRFIAYAQHDPTGPTGMDRVAMLRVYARGLREPEVAQRLVYAVRGRTDEVEDALLVRVIQEERERMIREGEGQGEGEVKKEEEEREE
ncbi:uncharacterized protein BDZ99DRAFT_518045 [Mytilinidion resinicola]|uniref:Uncharacterized protein n=1 Tax=Mytilinidion resinicola TaxID=574789 RepID=A0A6A6YUG7_9PEZI|nr:uncharacterized protein BDZ99DRAFT_518045 [Mytilinidion resinicola]KAF2812188.1 hypothetical protein BDZ99DRAFT_518045 [Mytilinidion resinicola]